MLVWIWQAHQQKLKAQESILIDANEAYTARYSHETVALAFALTEEAIEDNLYDRLGARYTKALARSMAHTKQVKAAAVLNNAFNASFTGGDGVELCSAVHPLVQVVRLQTNHQLQLILTKLR